MKHATIPAAMARIPGNAIMAAQSPQSIEEMFAALSAAQRESNARNSETIKNISDAMNAMQTQIEGGGAIGMSSVIPVEPEYSQAFASYFRKGEGDEYLRTANAIGQRATIHAAMSVGDTSSGGYLAPVEWDRKISERQLVQSPMRRLATVQITSVGTYSTLWNGNQWGSGWVGETAARPQTVTPTLASIPFEAGEIYANAAATQRLLDDSAINTEAWLSQSIADEFNRQEGIAFISGNGVNKPRGLLTYVTGGTSADVHPGGNIDVVTSALTFDALTDFLYGLSAAYRQNSTWLMSSLTAAFIAKIKDADNRPIWRESIMAGQPSTLLGRPVEIDELMPPPAANNMAIAFGDFKAAYVINDRLGTRILRDPYTNKPYVMFYVTKRVGAGLLDPFAMRFLKVAA